MKPFLLLIGSVLPVLGDMEFRVGRMPRGDVPFGKGQCNIRLRIDNEAEVRVNSDRVWIRTLSGLEARNEGSQCNLPLPGQSIQGFNFEVLEGRGDTILLSPPFSRNGYTAAVRIRDSARGSSRYTFRLSWSIDEYGTERREPVPENTRGVKRALEVCQSEVVSRIADQYKYRDVVVRNIHADDKPGRGDYVLGEATARRGFHEAYFAFVCDTDLKSGRVRSVDVHRR